MFSSVLNLFIKIIYFVLTFLIKCCKLYDIAISVKQLQLFYPNIRLVSTTKGGSNSMKLLVCALIGKFGDSSYTVSMTYGDADSKCYPSPPHEVTNAPVLEKARNLSSMITLTKGNLRDSAFFYDISTLGSYTNAKKIDLVLGKPVNRNMVLASFEGISIGELNDILSVIKKSTESSTIAGRFALSGNVSLLSKIKLK